jgi:type II secretory pathway pseudopilin PulG
LRPRSERSGFTLIETLGAVVLFALAMTAIVIAQTDGAAYAGDALRRADASLWAEQLLVEVEQATALGTPPSAGQRELAEERGGVELSGRVTLTPLDPEQLGLELTPPTGEAAVGAAGAPAQAGLFAKNAAQPAVYQVEIRVAWLEGLAEREVTRTSFLLNPGALEALAAAHAPEEPQP